MKKPKRIKSKQLPPLNTQKYERYLPTAFDDSLTILEKINKVIHFIHEYTGVTNEMIERWNEVYEWVMNEGLENAVYERLDEMEKDGTLDEIINQKLFSDLVEQINDVDIKIDSEINDLKNTLDLEMGEFEDNVTNLIEVVKREIIDSTNERIDKVNVLLKGNLSRGVVNQGTPKGTLTIIDDDIRSQLYSIFYPFLKRKNIKINSAVISSRVGQEGHININQLREMRDSGLVEFVNHSHSHIRLDEESNRVIDDEIRKCEEFLREEGIFSRHFVYPFGRINKDIREIAMKYVDSGSKSNDLNNKVRNEVLDTYQLNRVNFEVSDSTMYSRIDKASERDEWLIINTHSQYPTFDINRLENIIDYALSKNVEIKTVNEALVDFRNIVELRREGGKLVYGINADGFIDGEKIYKIYHPNEIPQYTISSRPETYPFFKVSTFTMNRAYAQEGGFPGAGILTTYRFHNDDYTYQEFMPIRSRKKQVRYWNSESGGSWSSFVEV